MACLASSGMRLLSSPLARSCSRKAGWVRAKMLANSAHALEALLSKATDEPSNQGSASTRSSSSSTRTAVGQAFACESTRRKRTRLTNNGFVPTTVVGRAQRGSYWEGQFAARATRFEQEAGFISFWQNEPNYFKEIKAIRNQSLTLIPARRIWRLPGP
jgi:hypothetical protein